MQVASPALPFVREDELVASDCGYILERLSDEFAEMAGSRLLITGGAGFLGYYLIQSVLAWNRRTPAGGAISLTIYDNFARGVPAWLSSLEQDAEFSIVRHNVIEPLPPEIGAFDYIVHAAGIASPTYYRKFPIETMDANITGLRSLLDYALSQRESGRPVRGFLFFSSSEIYGDPPADQIPTTEDYRGNVSCTGPRSCYDESKRYGETLSVNFARQYGLPITVARPFNNYGPGLKITDRRVLPDFARDMLAGRDIVLLSDGSPSRTFCYSADAIVGYYKVLVRGRPGEAYNIGTEAPEVSMAELAERVAEVGRELFGYRGQVVRRVSAETDYLADNPARRCPDISKARAELGYEPGVDLEEGLRRALTWYHFNREAEEG
jgi:nucleoside-diphosphate-sugar epimerase